MILGAFTAQQKVGLVVAGLLFAGWAVFVVAHVKKAGYRPGSERELAPNRKPYYEDDILETKRLDRALAMALLLLIITAIGLPLYWTQEETRKANAAEGFEERSVERGHSLYLPTDSPEHGAHFGCADCHGLDGSGGSTTYTITDVLGRSRQVEWTAPPLDTAAYRFPTAGEDYDPTVVDPADALRIILVYGRAGTPMPAWGVAGGGALNDQQIDDLVNYMRTPVEEGGLMIPREEATAAAREAAEGQARVQGKTDAQGNPVVDGEVLFNTNCARCHTQGWSYGEPQVAAGGRYGPNLTNGATVRQFPDIADMIEFVTEGVLFGEAYGQGGVGSTAGGGMPHFGDYLSEEDIRAIVEYERGL